MKRILLIGLKRHRKSFIARLNLEANEQLVINGEKINIIERSPRTALLESSDTADFAISVGLSNDNDVYKVQLRDIPSTLYFLDEDETPRQCIEESLKFEKALSSTNERCMPEFAIPSFQPAAALCRFGTFCSMLLKGNEQEESIEMKTFKVISPGNM
jgi:hypothetical protein